MPALHADDRQRGPRMALVHSPLSEMFGMESQVSVLPTPVYEAVQGLQAGRQPPAKPEMEG